MFPVASITPSFKSRFHIQQRIDSFFLDIFDDILPSSTKPAFWYFPVYLFFLGLYL